MQLRYGFLLDGFQIFIIPAQIAINAVLQFGALQNTICFLCCGCPGILKIAPAVRKYRFKEIPPSFIIIARIFVQCCASDPKRLLQTDIRLCCLARLLLRSSASRASIPCRTSVHPRGLRLSLPSFMRQFSGAATMAHAVNGIWLSIMSSMAS